MALNDSFVTTGFSQPYAARYNYDATEGTVTYSGGLKVGRGVSVSLEVEQNDGDGFYADNILAESDQGQFTAGTANVTIDGLDKEAANLLLNVPQVADSAVAPNDKIYYGAETQVENGYVGFGYIVRQRFHNRTWYRVHILPKVQFGIPGESAETSTDSINYQTTTLKAIDGSLIAFPNTTLFSKTFKNLTKSDSYEYVAMPVGVAYGTDVEKARKVIVKALAPLCRPDKFGREMVKPGYGIQITLNDFGDNSVNLMVKQYVLVEQRYNYIAKANELIYKALRDNNIEIPFPQQDVYIKQAPFPGEEK